MAKVTSISLKPALLSLKGSLPKNLVEAASDPAVAIARRAMEPIVQDHYDNVVKEIGRKLNGLGMAQGVASSGKGVRTGSVRHLGFGRVNGDVGQITTKKWKPLQDRYAASQPTSLWFWQKLGMNNDPRSLSAAYGSKVLGKQKSSVWAEHKSKRNHHKGRINVTMTLWFHQLPKPFDVMITQAFAGASEMVTLDSRAGFTDRLGLSRARWAEDPHFRPFVRRMSAALGKDMRKDLARQLRNL